MASKANGSVVGIDKPDQLPTPGVESDPGSARGSTKIGDIIESEPDERDFKLFPNLGDAARVADSGAAAGSTPKRKPGRPKGSGAGGTANKRETAEKNLDGIENLLLGIHAGVAFLTGFPEMEWHPDDAKKGADALKTFAESYGKVIDPKTMAGLNLLGTFSWLEGTRIMAIRQRLKEEKNAAKPPAAPVVEFPNRGGKTNGAPPPNTEPARPTDTNPLAYMLNPIKE